jgi:hypothetical protein
MKETINDLMELKSLISQKIESNHDECIDAINKAESSHSLKYLEGYSKALTNCKLMVSDAILELIKSKLTTHPENELPITNASAEQ